MLRRETQPAAPAPLEAMAAALERAGLVEAYLEAGRVHYRTTAEGERVGRMLSMADRTAAEALLDALLQPADDPPRHH